MRLGVAMVLDKQGKFLAASYLPWSFLSPSQEENISTGTSKCNLQRFSVFFRTPNFATSKIYFARETHYPRTCVGVAQRETGCGGARMNGGVVQLTDL